MTQTPEELALEFARMSGRIAAVLEWCVKNKHQCLADNPTILRIAELVLRDTRKMIAVRPNG